MLVERLQEKHSNVMSLLCPTSQAQVQVVASPLRHALLPQNANLIKELNKTIIALSVDAMKCQLLLGQEVTDRRDES